MWSYCSINERMSQWMVNKYVHLVYNMTFQNALFVMSQNGGLGTTLIGHGLLPCSV
jgi:hypothetical protein